MKKQSLSLLLLACMAASVQAREIPAAGRKDARMRYVTYDPRQVVRVSTAVGAALVVSFSPDEKVTAVAATNSKDLTASPRDNFLFLKAKLALSPQPVIVLTSGPHGIRRYVFEVAATPMTNLGTENPDVYYSIEFRYPADEAATRMRQEAQSLASERRTYANYSTRRATNILDTAGNQPSARARNWHYVAQGNRSLMPVEMFDDGYSTTFRFPGNSRVPAIFRLNPDGKEATVNYATKGEYVVVGAVASAWRLRDGDTALCIYNRAFDRLGRPTGTGTTSPTVRRIMRNSPQ